MKPSASDLLAIARRFYPPDRWPDEPGYSETEEDRRLMEAVRRAGSGVDYERWESMLDRLEATLPGRIHNTAMSLTAGVRSPAYEAICRLLDTDEAKHNVGFSVSFLVPCYVVYGWRWSESSGYEVRFDLDETERPYAQKIAEEIEATYGYEPMPPEVGTTLVAEVEIAGVRYHYVRRGMIYDYLLTVRW
jgi:hypothetical protein